MSAAGALELSDRSNSARVSGYSNQDSSARFTGKGGATDFAELVTGDDAAAYLSSVVPSDLESTPYGAFAAHAREQSFRLEAGEGVQSVVLVPRVDIAEPEMMECAGKPLAAVIDLDHQTESDWASASTLYRQNGLNEALRVLHDAEISVIWVSDEPAAAAEKISAILAEGGLANQQADDFLFLDRGGKDRKQVRRWDAARYYCIVAIAGDERGDFDELYDYLRNPDGADRLDRMFGNGWFLAPPPFVTVSDEGSDAPIEEDG